ncbi:hypothetical protein [Zhihengliuella salsuginis]|uniref:hypothetical protein n=1 Tax=Zhihengliuella salsuginis TaxID=578222 RepID=UPI001676172B|nr:hypothetical protein [Zhihengliuella salsuginis]
MHGSKPPVLDLRLFRGQIWPRRRQLVSSWAPYISMMLAILVSLALPFLPAASTKISDAASHGLTFSSISVGACFTSLVLSLGLPGARRLRDWSRRRGALEGKSVLSDLVFVLVWAGLSQLSLIFVCVFAMLFGGDLEMAPVGMYLSHFVTLIAGMFAFFYAVFELVIVIQTLSQIGVIIIAEEQRCS